MASRKATAEAKSLLATNGIESPPVDVDGLASTLGLSVVRQPYDGNLSGMLQRQDQGAIIGVNSLHARVRQRFTIAHEIGHYLLHKRETFIDEVWVDYRDHRSSAGTYRQEVEANAFAAELLMPEALVRKAMEMLIDRGIEPTGLGLAEALADEFDVSVEAMSHRLTNLAINLQI